MEVGRRVRVLVVVVRGDRWIRLRKEELEQREEWWRRRGRMAEEEEGWWNWGVAVGVIEEIRPATDMASGKDGDSVGEGVFS
ncbi:hypothetical protein L1987_79731 [Smallanthus sonchifolius]|uniref:Uncharacterized protein n=1 Tax=Smallanthus sonchifolius TaxID=185202 RepID=A0ACB8YKR9_9ASTR|nr:hypothetical protein L1987_79731 [Smallanthus sonchifolius]